MNRTEHFWWHDLAWAGVIVVLAAILGMWLSWPSIKISQKMWELPTELRDFLSERGAEYYQGVKTVNLEQTHELFIRGEALFIDARNPDDFAELHIPGAINISPEMIMQKEGKDKLAKVHQDKEIVVYCDQITCDLAIKVAEQLQKMGFTRVRAFMLGFRHWDMAGYPAATSR